MIVVMWMLIAFALSKKGKGKKNKATPSPPTPPSEPSLIRTAREIHDTHGFVGVSMLNAGYLNMTKSWLCNTEGFDSHRFVLFVTTDETATAVLKRDKVDFDRAFQVESVVSVPSALAGPLSYEDKGYWQWLVFRVKLVRDLLRADLNVVLFETDAVWFRCAFEEWLTDQRYRKAAGEELVDVEGVADGAQSVSMGFGFLRITANERTKALWTLLVEQFEESVLALGDDPAGVVSEQQLLNNLLKEGRATFNMLSGLKYTNGKYYMDDHSEQRKNFAQFDPVMINNNYVSGVSNKEARAKRWRHWFLSEEGTCDADNIAFLDATLSWEPLEHVNGTELHARGCWGFLGHALWCRCCSNDVQGQRENCKTQNGFCTKRCVATDDQKRAYCPKRPRGAITVAPSKCANRFLFAPPPQGHASGPMIREHLTRSILVLALARRLDMTAVLSGIGDVNVEELLHLDTVGATECFLTLPEARDLHPQFDRYARWTMTLALQGAENATVVQPCRSHCLAAAEVRSFDAVFVVEENLMRKWERRQQKLDPLVTVVEGLTGDVMHRLRSYVDVGNLAQKMEPSIVWKEVASKI